MIASDKTMMLVLGASLLAGCGWKTDGSARLEQLYPSADQGDAGTQPTYDPCGLPDDPSAQPFQVSGTCSGPVNGRWAVRMVEFAYISPIGSQWNLRLTDYFVATTDGTSMQLQFCDEAPTLTKPDGTPVTLGASHLHAGTAAAIGTLPLVLTPATPFSVPQTPWLWGVHAEMLANPATDPLPTSPTDPAVWDQDNDGQPGVTEDISNPDGHQYQAHRDVWTLGAGNATDPNWLTGPLTFSVEQVVLDADNAQLKIATPINVLSKCQSVYQMRCVDESITCETLLANASTLFKGAPK